MNKRSLIALLIIVVLALSAIGPSLTSAQDPVELRITWYSDGVEGDVLRDLLDRFEAENPDIKVVVDTVAYKDLDTTLQPQLEAGEPPDMARVTLIGKYRSFLLDLTPYVADPAYWTASFPEAVLNSMRKGADDTGIYGFPNQFTVTGPFINRTLFEQAGVAVPSDTNEAVTWEEWVEAASQVASALSSDDFKIYAVAIDRSGHRFWGPSLSRCATYINDDGSFTVDSPGFRSTAEMIIGWHQNGLMPAEVWAGTADGYADAKPFFINGQLVMYMSGSWQVGGFAKDIGDLFDWEAVPNPSGDCGSTGIPGGSLVVAFQSTKHPEEVARVMDYLASEEVLREFSARTLFLPGHTALTATGVEFTGNDPNVALSDSALKSLNVFVTEVGKLAPEAYALQYHPFTGTLNPAIRDRLSQVIVGELTLDEAIARIQQDVDEAMKPK